MTSLEQSWARAWQNLKLAPSIELFDQLLTAYDEPQRHYHTQQHLLECLSHFSAVMGTALNPGEVELALWFHDAVYDVRGHNNEHLSAQWATQALATAGTDEGVTRRVHALIMATCHDAAPSTPDQALLVDIDLSILGAPVARFTEYDGQVQEEYNWVPRDMYHHKRKEVMLGFLGRSFIYSTPLFRESHEVQARANLANLVDRLGTL